MTLEQEKIIPIQNKMDASIEEAAWDYYHAAKKYEALGMSFERAIEMVVGKSESLHLKTESGSEITIGPLAAIEKLERSFENESIRKAVYSLDPFADMIEKTTDRQAVAQFVGQWIVRNPNTLRALGIKNWKDLSPHQSILLSTIIVNDSMEYSHAALTDNELGKALDGSGAEQLLEQGKGVCRHYAAVTKIVFESVKASQISDRLAGIKMFYESTGSNPSTIHNLSIDARNHAFNIVAIGGENSTIHISIIDPTWSDPDQHLPGNHYGQEWERELDKFYTRSAVAINFLERKRILYPNDNRNEQAIKEWLDLQKQYPTAILNFIAIRFFKEISAETAAGEGRDHKIIKLVEYLKDRRSKWPNKNIDTALLILESEAFKSLRWSTITEGRLLEERDMVWNELKNISGLDTEGFTRDPALYGLFVSEYMSIAEKDGLDLSYEIENGLNFGPLNVLIRFGEQLKLLRGGEKLERLSGLSLKLKDKLFNEFYELCLAIETFVNDKKISGSHRVKLILFYQEKKDALRLLKQASQSYLSSLSLMRLSDEDKKRVSTSADRLEKTITLLENNWSDFQSAIIKERELEESLSPL